MRLSLSFALVVIAAPVLCAQEIRGTVTEAGTGAPLGGVVIQLLDSARAVLGRNISNERGQYRLALGGRGERAKTLKLVRIGFLPRETAIAVTASGVLTVDARMTALPTMLEPVRVMDQPNCPKRDDRGAAFALWEQAQTALLGTIVAREANPGSMLRLGYHRTLDRNGDKTVSQTVRIDSTFALGAGFVAPQTAAEFVRTGFMDIRNKSLRFLGPDAETILSDDFLAGYCLRVAPSDNARPAQVGLGFEAANHQRGRIDIDGTIWIDTAARALRDIEFRYVGLDGRLDRLHPGGHMEFLEMPNGTVLLQRWNLRLVGAETTAVISRSSLLSRIAKPYAQDGGGEVALVTWPDGRSWTASLGTLHVAATHTDGSPARNRSIHLSNSGYTATTDTNGVAEIAHVLPGSYDIMVDDPRFARVSVAINTGAAFTAARDTTFQTSIIVPSAEDAVRDLCVENLGQTPDNPPWLFLRVLDPEGQPVAGVTLSMRMEKDLNNWVQLRDRGTTGTDGMFAICRGLEPGANLVVQARRGDDRVDAPLRLQGDLTVARIRFPMKP
ncbi:MAG: carboxypeptidase-like regulatory domain-containing protein [Gemmatimonadaceae bacterium]